MRTATTPDAPEQDLLRRFPGRRVLVVGDVMLDEYLCGDVKRISPEAPVPVIDVQRRTCVPGGAANAAANVAGLRVEVVLASVVGADEAGQRLRQALAERGVSDDGLFVAGGLNEMSPAAPAAGACRAGTTGACDHVTM